MCGNNSSATATLHRSGLGQLTEGARVAPPTPTVQQWKHPPHNPMLGGCVTQRRSPVGWPWRSLLRVTARRAWP